MKLDGKLVQISDGKPFVFFVSPNNQENQRRYHAIGRFVDQYIYGLLQAELKLRPLRIPVCVFRGLFLLIDHFFKIQPKDSEPTSFFFASDDAKQADYLMVIIHGMGVVRAGQWSRR